VLDDKTELRFTRKNKVLYVYFLSTPKNKTITITDCSLVKDAKAFLVGEKVEAIRLVNTKNAVQIELPKKLPQGSAFLVKISGLEE
jgi:hypothetical protein